MSYSGAFHQNAAAAGGAGAHQAVANGSGTGHSIKPSVSSVLAVTYTASDFHFALNPTLEAKIYTSSHARLTAHRGLTLSRARRELHAALESLRDAQLELHAAKERSKATEKMLQDAGESADIFALNESKREAQNAAWAARVLGGSAA